MAIRMKLISGVSVAPFLFLADGHEVRPDHIRHECLETRLVAPSELGARLAWVSAKVVNFGGTEITRINLDQNFARFLLHPFFRLAGSHPHDRIFDMRESLFHEFAH